MIDLIFKVIQWLWTEPFLKTFSSEVTKGPWKTWPGEWQGSGGQSQTMLWTLQTYTLRISILKNYLWPADGILQVLKGPQPGMADLFFLKPEYYLPFSGNILPESHGRPSLLLSWGPLWAFWLVPGALPFCPPIEPLGRVQRRNLTAKNYSAISVCL